MQEIPDLLQCLNQNGLELVIHEIFEKLNLEDLHCCQLVCKEWYHLVERLWEHHEYNRVGKGWSEGNPTSRTLQCEKQRAVCTVSGIAVDESSIVVGLGSSGIIQLWSRRKDTSSALWTQNGHKEGVYSVDMNTVMVVSGGEDSTVKLWNRSNGELLHNLKHLHDYIVWNVKLWQSCLFTAGYDCVVNYVNLEYKNCNSIPVENPSIDILAIEKICGPFSWADALSCDHQGKYMVTHNDETFELLLWDLSIATEISAELTNIQNNDLEINLSKEVDESALIKTFDYPSDINTISLRGHDDEVHCVKFFLPFLVSGSADKTIRIWKIHDGSNDHSDVNDEKQVVCLKILSGHEGKVWSIDIDSRRIVSGGRFGEIKVWSLSDCLDSNDDMLLSDTDASDQLVYSKGRSLHLHDRTTAVGQIKIKNGLLISCDGLGQIIVSDFWRLNNA